MIRPTILLMMAALIMSGCNNLQNKKMTADNKDIPVHTPEQDKKEKEDSMSAYAPVNGINMYYEVHGKGEPLVLIHGGGSTIGTTFGRVLHSLAQNRKVIAVELQAHGHTADINRPLTFEQDADDIAALMKYLKIEKASFLGFSNGGNTAMQIAIRHPALVHKLIIASSFYKREGLYPQLWSFLKGATIENMPQQLKDEYLNITHDPKGLSAMHDKDKERMLTFKDWKDEDIQSIHAPALLIIGNKDIVTPEHAVEMYRLLPYGQLIILPGGHGDYIGEITTENKNSKLSSSTVAMIEEFLDAPMPEKLK
jgi:pimeloyl-ACP methyl ester carboxylesterase